jgi:ABC-type multidrug transport system fused ATPase/permease subunit
VIGLLVAYLRPYRGPLILVIGLLLVQAIGNLYLPDLNADIINNGVVKGDNGYILRTGAFMLIVTALLGFAAVIGVYWGARVAMGFGRDLRSAIFSKVMEAHRNQRLRKVLDGLTDEELGSFLLGLRALGAARMRLHDAEEAAGRKATAAKDETR